jgi:hypothetical protein
MGLATDGFMKERKMFLNYKTTIAGCLGGLTIFLYGYVQSLSTGAPFDRDKLVIGIVLAILGVLSKDFNSTGGTVPTTPEAVIRVERQEAVAAVAVAVEAKKDAAEAVAKTK